MSVNDIHTNPDDTDMQQDRVAAKPKPKRAPAERRTGQLSGVQVMFAVILAVGLILAINFSSRIAASQPLLEAYDSIAAEIRTLEAQQADLVVERDFSQSDAYVEQWARNRGKMVRAGERLIIPVPAGIPEEPIPILSVQTEFQTGLPEPEPWEYWWQLFFDTAPPQFSTP